ncbi:L-histidine carboxy-lyase (histamine-forming) [Chitinophaga jiangningensis]|uniref:L-histidine carboxy-lyase (Histamine-forming) n=1 Tax=Chitinophaga jiangningensis TaxID=1419482 RepID=A0A1M7B543_9BACT|nr:histidine decarboxylase [Chitinophaga jiangningensis]SHL50092.1 L-histidine carboxy-lyase (histamine-forming) [Chitinophaga jiangningensis]
MKRRFGLLPADTTQLEELLHAVAAGTADFLGYPVAKDFDYSPLMPFLQYPLNNLGDPFIPSTYSVGTREMEKYVVEFFAKLFRAPANDWWGYVTNGGSEGNLYGLYLARELYPKGMVYYSAATHYSVQKNIHLLNMPGIVIRTLENGEIDYEDLEAMISQHRHLPVIILANIGTTMTEARDDVKRIRRILDRMAVRQHYIHADGALSGSYSAFLQNRPAFDFADGANSIAISGHKFIGSPIPCGVVVAQKSFRDRIARSVAYIGTMDTTITGSRNGHSPLFLWYALKRYGAEGLAARAQAALEVAAYATGRLQAIGIAAWRNPDTLTVVFPAPEDGIREKWQLASENGWSHIICMPGVTHAHIDAFVAELEAAGVMAC